MNFAIRTHKRPHILSQKTWSFLRRHGIKTDEIHLFICGEDQAKLYESYGGTGAHIHNREAPGIPGAADAVQRHWPVGEWVVHLDDDIEELFELTSDGLRPLLDFRAMCQSAHAEAAASGVDMWGIYPVHNHFFMKQRTAFGLYFIWSGCYGFQSLGEKAPKTSVKHKDDFERSIRSYLRNGAVMRLDNICCKTNWNAEGGTHSEGNEKLFREHREAAHQLHSRYPHLVRLRKKKGFGGLDVVLVNHRGRGDA